MCAWHFKKKVIIKKKEITNDARKFEFLVCDYLNACFPLEHWKITPATNDGNRDIEASSNFIGKSMWAEAKYSIHDKTALNSRKYDSTLVSAKNEGNIIKIFFVTNTIIGTHLIERVSTFCHLIHVDEIQFVEKSIMEHWISQHPEIQKKYFNKWEQTNLAQRIVSLRTVRIFHRRDSYTIDTLLESQKVAPLYKNSNYIFEGEIAIIGYENVPLILLCENEILYEGVIHSGIHTFNLTKILQNIIKQSHKECTLNFYYNENGENIPFGTYKVTLSTPITFYNSQLRAFNYIHKQLSLDRQLIYNIYGETCTGKSWILKRLQEDLVSKYDDNSKTIYISFNGSMQDIRALCRLIFTLIFDYYNLGISGEALDRYCQSIGERTSIFSYDKINTLINALKHDLYHEAENILMHCIELDEYPLFEYLDSFAWRKIYIIDNIHLLNDNSKKIFRRILESFQSQKQIIFIISSRKKLDIDTCDNYELQKLQNDEILSLLNQRLNVPVNDLTEILPEDNQLGYPVIINQFLNELGENISNHYLRDYYAKNFSKTAIHYLTTKTFSFSWTAPLVVVFLVNVGVDSAILMNYQPQSYWSDLLEQDIITLNHGEFCANYLVSEKEIQHALKKYSVECEKLLFELLETTENPARYRNAIFKYCPRYYNQLWKEQFNEIKKKHHANCYHEVRELCNATLINKNYFHGSACEMRQVEYLQAFSYMHCNSSEEALPMLQSILKEYNNHSTKDTLYYTVYSEIIDAQYWTWKNYNTMASDINKYRKDWTKNHENLQLENRAYLTVTNRMMVYLLAEDKLSQAERWMKKNLRLAVQFSSKEHIGYTLMDFAKGIYHVDLNKALRYLNEAEEIFRNSGNEQRRLLDCQCEIAYVKVLLNLTDAQELKDAASALYQNQYWIQYYKSNIKLICAYLIQNNLSEAKKLLVQAKNSIIISESIRCEYLLSILATIIDNRFEKNTFEQADVPRSYRTLITHNQQSNKDMYQIYQKNLFSDMFYLDPRIW